MPFHQIDLTRREFLVSAAAGVLTLKLELPASSPSWVLIADTHIGATRETIMRETNMAANLDKVAKEIASHSERPAGVILNGDCALTEGLAADYGLLNELVDPLRKARIPLHMTLGNHDHRDRFWTRFNTGRTLQAKHVSVIETQQLNWFLLDSLDQTNVTPGLLGAEQLAWLKQALDQRPNKPAIVFAHHDAGSKQSANGLKDSDSLFAVLAPRKQVKAYVFGHTHHWSLTERDGIHLINLPPVAYVFQKGDPNGWVEMKVVANGADLKFHSLDPAHPAHGKTHILAWR